MTLNGYRVLWVLFILVLSPNASAQSVSSCKIKGNVSKNGKLYFIPSHPDYHRVRINKKKGKRWFCSEEEAVGAGWDAAGVMRSRGCKNDALDSVPDPQAPSSQCVIKGNASGKYHVPGGKCYSETLIHKSNPKDRWFCSEQEAVANGYVKSKI